MHDGDFELQLERRRVECMLAHDVDAIRGDALEHRRQGGGDARRRRRGRATGHDQRRLRVAWRGHCCKTNAGHFGTLGAVQGHVVPSTREPEGKIADERLGAAQLSGAQWSDGRSDNRDLHRAVLV